MDILYNCGKLEVKTSTIPNSGFGVFATDDINCGEILEEWNLHNAFITSAKFGDFDYSSEDMREIELTFKYDWASCAVEGDTFFRNG